MIRYPEIAPGSEREDDGGGSGTDTRYRRKSDVDRGRSFRKTDLLFGESGEGALRTFFGERSGRLWSVALGLALLAPFGWAQQAGDGAGPYEVVRGRQYALCRELARGLNRHFRHEPPQVCRRRFDAAMKDFRLPGWRELGAEEALLAALAVVPSGYRSHGQSAAVMRLEREVRDEAARGELRVWEARFDLARSGEKVRVVLVSRGLCRVENNFGYMDPVFGVLLPDRYETDPRYRYVSGGDGDIFFYQGLPYVAFWREFPSAEGRERAPKKEHHGYLMVAEPFWHRLPSTKGPDDPDASAGRKGPICQIGYQRLSRRGGVK